MEPLPVISVFAASLVTQSEKLKAVLWSFISHWRHVRPKNNGRSLAARGLPPSALYRTILKALRDAWLDGKVHTAGEEEAFLEDLLSWNQFPGSHK